MQPVSRTAEIEEHRVKSLKFGGSVITERLYIDIKQDLKKKNIINYHAELRMSTLVSKNSSPPQVGWLIIDYY